MPRCFQLTRVGEACPASLHDVDNAICHHFEVEANESLWMFNWYGTIGLMLACGKTWPEVIDAYEPGTLGHSVACFLASNYTTDAWWEPKR